MQVLGQNLDGGKMASSRFWKPQKWGKIDLLGKFWDIFGIIFLGIPEILGAPKVVKFRILGS